MKKFFILFSSQAASLFGSRVVDFALAWYLTQTTGSATVLAVSFLMLFVPSLILGPFIGPLIDRWNRKLIIIFSDLTTMLLTVVLVVLFALDAVQVWHIYLVMAARSISGIFQAPALGAAIPMIVPKEHLVRTSSLNKTLQGLLNIVSNPVGAFLMAALPVQWVLSVDIITALLAVGIMLPLHIPQPERTTLTAKMNVIGEMVRGFKYIVSWKGFLYLMILCALVNFFAGPINAVMPLFFTTYLGGDVLKYGWLQMSFGIGVVSSGLILGIWGGFRKRILTSLTGFAVWAIAIFLFGFATEALFYPAMVILGIAGMGITVMNAPIGAIIQARVDKDMQGRVFTMTGSMVGCLIPAGLLLTGPVSGAIGLRFIFFISGSVMLVLIVLSFFSKKIMHIEDTEESVTSEIPAQQ